MENIGISVVIVVHDQAQVLEQNLPLFLRVAEEVHAQVIVVDDMSTDDTPDVLQRLKAEHATLYTTFLPKSVIINPSRLRLALSVGAKAAKGDYVVLADINRPPVSAEWLTGLADGEAAAVFTRRKSNDAYHVVATDIDDLRAMIMKAERKSGRGHKGRWMKKRRGLYDAVSVRRKSVFDVIKFFDQPICGLQLAGLRLHVWL